MPRLPYLTMLLSLALAAGHAFAGPEEDQRARNALRVLTELQKIPEQTIPDKLLEEARAIVIIPDTLKVGFIIGVTPWPRPHVDQDTTKHMVSTRICETYRRQHRPSSRRAIFRRGTRVPQ